MDGRCVMCGNEGGVEVHYHKNWNESIGDDVLMHVDCRDSRFAPVDRSHANVKSWMKRAEGTILVDSTGQGYLPQI